MYRRKGFISTLVKEVIIKLAKIYMILAIVVVVLYVSLRLFSKPNIKITTETNTSGKTNIEADSGNKTVPKVNSGGKTIVKTPTKAKEIAKLQPEKKIVINDITRSSAFSRGMAIVNYVWDYNASRNGIKNSRGIALPRYLQGKSNIRTAGLPYCWGGYTSIDMSNIPNVKNFSDAIKKGYTAGNVNCTGNYQYLSAGLDCSGFVCAVFKIPEKLNTFSLNKYFVNINKNDLKPMDILNCETNHVLIYLKETNDKKGILTMEAAVDRNAENGGKTNIYYRSWDTINKGINGKAYSAMRYREIVNDGISPFKDMTEYNGEVTYATNIELGKQYKGHIDYASNIDYYRLNLNTTSEKALIISNLPRFCNVSIVDSKDRVISNFNKKGIYHINFTKGIYYIEARGVDFKFSSNESYIFNLKNSTKYKSNLQSVNTKKVNKIEPIKVNKTNKVETTKVNKTNKVGTTKVNKTNRAETTKVNKTNRAGTTKVNKTNKVESTKVNKTNKIESPKKNKVNTVKSTSVNKTGLIKTKQNNEPVKRTSNKTTTNKKVGTTKTSINKVIKPKKLQNSNKK